MVAELAQPPLPSRGDFLAQYRQGGGRIAAVFPIHQPRALFRAFGLLPVEVWGPPGTNTTVGDAHLQAYTCSIVRTSLSFALSERAKMADLVVVPHACDSTQGLGSILLDFLKPHAPVLPLYLSRGEGEAAIEFLTEELKRASALLSGWFGQRPTADEVLSCVEREEAADAALLQLHLHRMKLGLSSRAFYELVRTREFLPAEQFTELAAASLRAQKTESTSGKPVLLSGIVPEPMGVLDALERLGATVAADDLACTGRRLYPAGKSKDPYRRMAEGLLSAAPDSTLGHSVQSRLDHLLSLARRSHCRAAIFFEVKFCEPEQFYLPLLRRGLTAQGLKSVAVEVDPNEALPDQVLTRIEALLETTP